MKICRYLIFILFVMGFATSCNRPYMYEFPYESPPWQPKPIIVIDAGHGGKDSGASSSISPKYKEKTLNLSTAILLDKYLNRMGYKTTLTRDQDIFIPLQKRAEIANEVDSNLFVSIHFNASPNTEAQGIEVFYFDEKNSRTECSEKLAKTILSKLTEETEAKARGARKGDFRVIRETKMPAVLVEGGFLTNPSERTKILNKNYREKIALGIAKGIDSYIKTQQLEKRPRRESNARPVA